MLLTFGADRSYGGNAGYIDEPTKLYRFDNFVPNARRLAVGDIVVIRDRTAMLGAPRITSASCNWARNPMPLRRTSLVNEIRVADRWPD